ncbi:hypothetical protein TNCV_1840571 [Trichonephila clavipes]|nr:hypothetical protein TNCV_1840571 [Trichonephila clavipes]
MSAMIRYLDYWTTVFPPTPEECARPTMCRFIRWELGTGAQKGPDKWTEPVFRVVNFDPPVPKEPVDHLGLRPEISKNRHC